MTSVRVAEGELHWAGQLVPEAHVERLATIARLCGLEPAPVEACRVLELGSAGCPLVPLALAFPGSHFVGVGGSPEAMDRGRRWARELALTNVQLFDEEADELLASLGSFDYVIVHGTRVFTSVAAREAALWALNRRLSPSGIGYVSFNSSPGALIADAARRLLDGYAASGSSPEPRAARIRAIAKLLAASLEAAEPLALSFKAEFEAIARSAPGEPWLESQQAPGAPLYFAEFVQAIAPHALAYFAEAVPGEDDVTRLSSAARDALGQFVNTSALWQQSLDLYSGRAVRHALVRRAGPGSARATLLDTMRSFVVGCAARLELRDGELRLQAGDKAVAHVSDPGVSRAFVQLTRAWPEFLPFSTLAEQVHRDHAVEREERERAFAEQLQRLFRSGLVELRLHAPRCTTRPGERPTASELARRMAALGDIVVNQHQALVLSLDAEARRLLTLCNGERTREQLLASFSGERAPDVDALLERLARHALLVD